MAAASVDWDVLEFFKEEIHKDNFAEVRISAVKNLKYVACAMGQQKVHEDLIPFLNKEIGLDGGATALANDDEFLFQMATQYAMLKDYIQPDKVACLIDPLVHLAQQEETVIRDEAIASICVICNENPKLVRTQVYNELKAMATKPEFTTRVSACALFGTVYKIHKGNDDGFAAVRSDLCKAYKDICADDTPMVRRASANKLYDFVKELEVEDLTGPTFLEAYHNLAKEETQDTIRVNIVHTTIEMASKIESREINTEHCVPVIMDACKDRSWRVRLTVAKNFDEILKAFGPEISVGPDAGGGLITSLYSNGLLQDPEQEVRKEAVKVIEKCLNIGNNNKAYDAGINQQLMDIVKALVDLVSDQGQPVRAALAQALGPVATRLGKDTTKNMLLQIIGDLMKDEFHDVRLNIVSHAGTFCNVLTPDVFVHSLLHTVQSLIMDNHWRIRKTVVEQVPKLAEKFGIEMYQSKLESLFLASLKDSVYFVRKEALNQLKGIAETFGPAWTGDHLLTKIMELYGQETQQSGYASRVTVLQAMPQLWESISNEPSQSSTTVITLLTKALRDSVPNVRLCACKVITELLTKGPDTVISAAQKITRKDLISKIKPSLSELEHDSDSDVQYFAQQALQQCQKCEEEK